MTERSAPTIGRAHSKNVPELAWKWPPSLCREASRHCGLMPRPAKRAYALLVDPIRVASLRCRIARRSSMCVIATNRITREKIGSRSRAASGPTRQTLAPCLAEFCHHRRIPPALRAAAAIGTPGSRPERYCSREARRLLCAQPLPRRACVLRDAGCAQGSSRRGRRRLAFLMDAPVQGRFARSRTFARRAK